MVVPDFRSSLSACLCGLCCALIRTINPTSKTNVQKITRRERFVSTSPGLLYDGVSISGEEKSSKGIGLRPG
jgi:hypothetical protein